MWDEEPQAYCGSCRPVQSCPRLDVRYFQNLEHQVGDCWENIVRSSSHVGLQTCFRALIDALKLSDLWCSDNVSLVILGLISKKAEALNAHWDVKYVRNLLTACDKWMCMKEANPHATENDKNSLFRKSVVEDQEKFYQERCTEALDFASSAVEALADSSDFATRFPGDILRAIVDAFIINESALFQATTTARDWYREHPDVGSRLFAKVTKPVVSGAPTCHCDSLYPPRLTSPQWQWVQILGEIGDGAQRKAKVSQ